MRAGALDGVGGGHPVRRRSPRQPDPRRKVRMVSGDAPGAVPRGSAGRVVMWLAATAVMLVLLFAYKTSTGGATPAPPAQPPGVVGQPDRSGRAVVVNGSVV